MPNKVIERVDELISYYNLSYNAFDKKVGLSNGYIGRQIKNNANLGSHILMKIYSTFEEISGDWLLGADLPMLKSEQTFESVQTLKEDPEAYNEFSHFEKAILEALKKKSFRQYVIKIIKTENN